MLPVPSFAARACLALALVALAVGCGDDNDFVSPTATPAVLNVAGGDVQSAVVGATLPGALVVEVLDERGDPVAGITVTWSVTSGGGSVESGTSSTGADGRASTTWTLGGHSGRQTVTANVSDRLRATFTAYGEPGPPATVRITPDAPSLAALQAVLPLEAELVDAFGNPLGPTAMAWTSANPEVATVSPSGTVTAVANGTAEVRAEGGGVSGTVEVTVAQEPTMVAVSPETPTAVVGLTISLTAAAMDANGFQLPDPEVVWSSSNEEVLTVDEHGDVTGVMDGEAWVIAESGGVRDSVQVEVTSEPFEPEEDFTVSGELQAAEITIPAGVTMTLTGDAVIRSAGDMVVEGDVVGSCVDARFEAGGSLRVEGAIQATCEGRDVELWLESNGGWTIEGATFSVDGGVTVTNTGGVSPVAAPGPGAVTRLTAEHPVENCSFTTTIWGAPRNEASDWRRGRDGKTVAPRVFQCAGTFRIGDHVELGLAAGSAGEADLDKTDAQGGDGGRGQDLIIQAGGNLELFAGESFTGGALPGLYVRLGDGGDGGEARVVAPPGETARAVGGNGGRASLIEITARGRTVVQPDGMHLGSATGRGVRGGRGGDAFAHGGRGFPATSRAPAGPGYLAEAFGGRGGGVGREGRDTRLIGDLLQGRVTGGENLSLVTGTFRAGGGGDAVGAGGDGGSGSRAFPNGADGGDTQLVGGDAGPETLVDNRFGDRPLGLGGHGGDLRLGPDEPFQPGSRGGPGWMACILFDDATPGNGGSAGHAVGIVGSPTERGGETLGSQGTWSHRHWGTGGDGGAGLPPGIGGLRSSVEVDAGRVVPPPPGEDAWRDGRAGKGCEGPALLSEWEIIRDPAGHDPFIGMQSVKSLTISFDANDRVTILGPSPWIPLTGEVDRDGSFVATGIGTVAGVPGVIVQMEGSFDFDPEGRPRWHVFSPRRSTLTIDPAAIALPETPAGHRFPTVYEFTGMFEIIR